MVSVEPNEHIRALQREGELLAAAAHRAGLLATVPSCPGWQVRDLLRHMGYVHRWAASYVREQWQQEVAELTEAEQLRAGPADDELICCFRAGHAALVEVLGNAAPDVSCWTFLAAPSPLAFWARRQAHETAIHRADAELAAGQVTPFGAEFAADGIDELLIGFFGRDADGSADAADVLRVCATDARRDWHVWLRDGGRQVVRTGRGVGHAANGDPGQPGRVCTLTGPASALYLLFWNRGKPFSAGVRIDGDAGLLRTWQEDMHVTWQ
jgi:uncharacterized protein (TIGR03083 family)